MPEPLPLLLVEDDPVSRAFLFEVLAEHYRIDAFADGAAALAAARGQRYAALLLDLNLPGLRGPDLLAALRADPDACSQRAAALALTADHDPATRIALHAAGFAAVLGKPLGAARLRAAVAALLADAGAASPSISDGIDGGCSSASPPSGPGTGDDAMLPDWDDAVALRAANRNPAIVDALRGLLRGELPGQCERLRQAVDRDDHAMLRAELHKLRASAGFCGAARLLAAIERLSNARGGRADALDALLAAAERLTAAAAPETMQG